MLHKLTTNVANPQHFIHRLPAGIIKGDKSTEIFACRDTQKLFAISDGQTIPFEDLSADYRAQIFEKLLNDERAMDDLKSLSMEKAIEQFTFCIYGAADSEADFSAEGILKEADNFICSNNCRCLKWNSKKISFNGKNLTSREIEIIQLLATDLSDKLIADQLGITCSTLDTHKKNLFEKANVYSKNGLIVKAIENKIIQ